MDTILELIDRVSSMAVAPASAGLFAALAVLLVARRWQMQVLGLAILYLFLELLHNRVIRPEVALVKGLVGWLICLTFFVTGRYLDEQRKRKEQEEPEEEDLPGSSQERLPTSLRGDVPLRVLVLLAAFIIAYALSNYLPLPQVPGYIGLACYMTTVVGLFLTGISEDPLRVGMGLLVLLSGFDLFFGALEPSLVVAGLLGAAGFVLALAVTFLAVTRAASEEGEA